MADIISATQAITTDRRGVYAAALADIPWAEAGKPGIYHKPVREDDANGLFLGMLAFDALTGSDLHQHQATAISYFVDGGLTDYQGTARVGEVGVNLAGATHDAMAYQRTVLVARLEGPVVYPESAEPLHRLHVGARRAGVRNAQPEVMPDINFMLDEIAKVPTAVGGVARQLGFDYIQTSDNRRFSQLQFVPGSQTPYMRASDRLELWVRGGALEANGVKAGPSDFLIIEPNTEFQLKSDYGALVLAWADGPTLWSEGEAKPELFGF